jgi:hypothetical protein
MYIGGTVLPCLYISNARLALEKFCVPTRALSATLRLPSNLGSFCCGSILPSFGSSCVGSSSFGASLISKLFSINHASKHSFASLDAR